MKLHNMALKQGFTIIELVIGLLISTILTTIVFSIYQQITKSTKIIQRITTTDTQIIILKDRLQKDLLGISPLWFIPSKYEAMIKKTTPEDKEEKPHNNNNKDNQRDNDFFFSTNHQDGTLNLFSFITTSAMQTYGATNKYLVRVVYLLKKDASSDSKFTLLRKEMGATELNIETINDSYGLYEIATGIKTCSIEYGFINKAIIKDEKNEPDQKKTEVTWSKNWDAKEEKKDLKTQRPIFPKFIKINIVFFQENSIQEQDYELCFITPIDTISLYTSFTQKSFMIAQQTPQQQENSQPPTPTTTSSSPISANTSITITPHPKES